MIFVTVGTHTEGFDRLVRAADAYAAETGERVVAQIGSGGFEPAHAEWFRFDTPARIAELIAESSVVVTHAGAGSLLGALDAGRPVVAMPRLQRFGEVVDDHQLELAAALRDAGVLAVADETTPLTDAIQSARGALRPADPILLRAPLVEAVRAAIDPGAARSATPRRVRATRSADGSLHVVMLASVPFPPSEGIGVYVLQLSRRLVAAGHRVTVLTRGGLRSRVLMEEPGLRVVGLPYLPLYPAHVHLHTPFVRRALAKLAPDVIHAHSPIPPDPGFTDVPIVTTVHTGLRWDAGRMRLGSRAALLTKLQTPIAARIEDSLIRRSRIVGVVDPNVEWYVREADPLAAVEVLMNAVDTAAITPGPEEREPNVLCVGRLAPSKGVDDLLEAWPSIVAAVPAARLTIIGEGPLGATLREQATRLGIDGSVSFLGALGADRRGELVEAFRDAAVLVQPSHNEGLSTVILEGMAAATPVVATTVGAHEHVITSGTDGILLPPGHHDRLAAEVSALLADPLRRRLMGARGRATVAERFAWDRLAPRHVELYRRAIGSKTPAASASNPASTSDPGSSPASAGSSERIAS